MPNVDFTARNWPHVEDFVLEKCALVGSCGRRCGLIVIQADNVLFGRNGEIRGFSSQNRRFSFCRGQLQMVIFVKDGSRLTAIGIREDMYGLRLSASFYFAIWMPINYVPESKASFEHLLRSLSEKLLLRSLFGLHSSGVSGLEELKMCSGKAQRIKMEHYYIGVQELFVHRECVMFFFP